MYSKLFWLKRIKTNTLIAFFTKICTLKKLFLTFYYVGLLLIEIQYQIKYPLLFYLCLWIERHFNQRFNVNDLNTVNEISSCLRVLPIFTPLPPYCRPPGKTDHINFHYHHGLYNNNQQNYSVTFLCMLNPPWSWTKNICSALARPGVYCTVGQGQGPSVGEKGQCSAQPPILSRSISLSWSLRVSLYIKLFNTIYMFWCVLSWSHGIRLWEI